MSDETTLEVLRDVLSRSGQGLALELRRVPPAPNLQQRLGPGVVSDDLDRARTLSHEKGIPFWHSVFRLGAQRPSGVDEAVLNAAMYRQETEPYAQVSFDERFIERAEDLIAKAGDETYVVAASRVSAQEQELESWHIPMLDFSVKERWAGAAQTALGAIRALAIPGTLLASGRSFHFVGDTLVPWHEYSRLLYRALLLVPVVDERWIGHQLLAGEATLRVSANSQGDVPRAIARVA